MSIWEIVFIAIGLSFDVLAVTIVEGAMLADINKKKLMMLCGIFSGEQVIAVILGNLITLIPIFHNGSKILSLIWTILSFAIFFAMAAFMFYRAWKREPIFEKVSDVNFKQVAITGMLVSLDAFFAGIAFGFLNAGLLFVGLFLAVITLAMVWLGIYIGYRLGYEQRTKALFIGGCCILFASIEVVVQYLLI